VATKDPLEEMIKSAEALQERGETAGALGLLENVLDQNPGHPGALHAKGTILAVKGDFQEAELLIRKALSASPDDSLVGHSLATIFRMTGRNKEALEILKPAHKNSPGNVQILLSLGEVYNALDDFANAVLALEQADKLAPKSPAILVPYSKALSRTDNLKDAVILANISIQLKPDSIQVLENASEICFRAGQVLGVIKCLEHLVALKPEEKRYHSDLARFYEKTHQFEKAYQAHQNLWDDKTATAFDYAKAGEYAYYAQHAPEAIVYLEKSLALEAKSAHCWTFLGRCHSVLGDTKAATDAFHKAVEADPKFINAYFFLSEIKKFEPDDPVFTTLEGLKTNASLKTGDESALGFALGRMYHGIEDYDKAFENYSIGNKASRKHFSAIGYNFKPVELAKSYKMVTALYSPENRKKLKHQGSSSKKPVFIVGLPRSGTTLLEQIMSAHSEISSAGELSSLTECHKDLMVRTTSLAGAARETALLAILDEQAETYTEALLEALRERGGDTPMVIDKMPQNFLQLGLINVLFPNARIIHMHRDPLDVGLSIFCNQFAGDWAFAQDLGDIGFYIRQYRTLMADWKKIIDLPIHEVDYQALLDDPEGVAKGVIDFCGLKWQPECLEFYKKRGRVFTASVMQVRNPINKSAVGKWKKYEKHLGPLKAALEG